MNAQDLVIGVTAAEQLAVAVARGDMEVPALTVAIQRHLT